MKSISLLSRSSRLSAILLLFSAFVHASVATMQPEETTDALLNLAYAGVSEMPVRPHIKNRSRAQIKVVETALQLNRPEWAAQHIPEIKNWQQWMAKADLACFYAQHGRAADARVLLAELDGILKTAQDRASGAIVATAPNALIDSLEGWRLKKVMTRTLETREVLNAGSIGAPTGYDLSEEEIVALKTGQITGGTLNYAAAFDQLRRMADTQDFEILHPVLLGMVRLLDMHYTDFQVGDWAEQELFPHFVHTPVFVRVDVLEHLAEVALKHGDKTEVLALCDTMEVYISQAALPAQFHVEEMSRVLKLRLAAGGQGGVLEELNALTADFVERKDSVVSIYRAKPLCSMAEVYALAGQSVQALELYAQAMDEARINPNSRPQAEDLCTLCCSMALAGITPSAEWLSRLESWKEELGRPW